MSKSVKKDEESNDCFIIMPISDYEGYDKGHFKKVYEDILKIACEKAGFNPVRADDVKQTNLIHLDILQKLIKSPMAVCDLSTRNPNVLFELGLRQAFDKPTVLVQEVGTPKIFDISPLRFSEYRKELKYREVLEDQNFIAQAIKATKEATDKGEGVNSIVGLLSLSSPASLNDVTDNDTARMFQIVMSEMSELREDFRKTNRNVDEKSRSLINRKYQWFYNAVKDNFTSLHRLITQNANYEDVKKAYDQFQSSFVNIRVDELSHSDQLIIEQMNLVAQRDFAKYIADPNNEIKINKN